MLTFSKTDSLLAVVLIIPSIGHLSPVFFHLNFVKYPFPTSLHSHRYLPLLPHCFVPTLFAVHGLPTASPARSSSLWQPAMKKTARTINATIEIKNNFFISSPRLWFNYILIVNN